MANKRQPDNVHLLKGTFQKCRHGNPGEKIKVELKKPTAPKFIQGEARKEWNRVCKLLFTAKVISQLDRSVLSQYCVLWGQLSDDPGGFNAAQHTQLRMCAAELGITAVTRSKVSIPQVSSGNKFAE